MSRQDVNDDYYVGLDCGVSSVGWAVTDPEYHLLRAKGKTMWGSRLFDEANHAAERRLIRGTRRRGDRANARLKLLRVLFKNEMVKVDPDFYKRLDESFYILEDKQGLTDVSSDTLFNDLNFKDKDFHKKYPTIWHLRRAIIGASPNEHFDLRLYFLAIQHIYKHRGHFLQEGTLKGNAGNFHEIYLEFFDAASSAGFTIREDVADSVEALICNSKKGKLDKKRELKEIFLDQDAHDVLEDSGEEDARDYTVLAGLLVGSETDLGKMFALETDEKCKLCFAKDVIEDKLPEIENFLGGDSGYLDVILSAKKIYDYVVLKNLLKDSSSISEAMVRNYDLHQEDLKEIKSLLKPFKEDYEYFFKAEQVIDKAKSPNYNSYIGKAYSKIDKNGRKTSALSNQTDLNAYLKKLFEKHEINLSSKPDFKNRLENGELLPKQRGQAKGTIPEQLHHNELECIIEKLTQDYPSFAAENPSENPEYNTIAKKLLSIHDFRRPYYCGPLKQRKTTSDGKIINKNGSQFSWADDEIKQIVYPWNFKELVDLDKRADNFILRMTNDCTYLIGEKVLPKASLLYQRYMVLNEINNLKINGRRLEDREIKMRIFEKFENGEFSGNLTAKQLEKKMRESQIIGANDELSGTAEHKTLPKLSTHQDLKRDLGVDYAKKYTSRQLEDAIQAITILGDEKAMLKKKLQNILGCSEEEAAKLSKRGYKDWGKLSEKFLSCIKTRIGVREMSILEALEEENANLMELLGAKYGFKKAIEDFNSVGTPQETEISFSNVEVLYCSPAVKRSVWQAARIVKEIVQLKGHAPKKIFLESTREELNPKKSGMPLARRRRLSETYSAITNNLDAKELLNELNSKEDRDFQNKKLFLYFQQMGKCAYCGKPINLDELSTEAYDIDHIYPQSLTKDDSLEKNKVLVCAECNRAKSNKYPISQDIRSKMQSTWHFWRINKLISDDKYNRLMREKPLTDEELGEFIARQIVETSQTVKAIRDLFKAAYPDTKIILVKAGQVSDLRHFYGYDRKDRETGAILRPGYPEFIKLRDLNDLHHAKDAYLNIVVGNTMSQTFTDDPVTWIKQKHPGDQKQYSIKTGLLFRRDEFYTSRRTGEKVNWPKMSGWNYDESFKIVSDALKRNDVLWTRMTCERSGQMSDLMIVGKAEGKKGAETQEGLVPIKQTARLSKTAVYGGYNSVKGAYFSLIEQEGKKGPCRRLVQIPIIYKDTPEQYLETAYPNSKIIIEKVLFNTLLKRNGFPLSLTGRSNETIKFYPAVQVVLPLEHVKTLKAVIEADKKIKEAERKKGKYELSEHDNLSDEAVDALFWALTSKLSKYFANMPTLGARIPEIVDSIDTFKALDLSDKVTLTMELVHMMGCNALSGDLTKIIPKSEHLGWGRFSNDITDSDMKLIHQSVTGLIEREIDLGKVQPKKSRNE